MIKAIIFDFDGVIVESVDIKTKAFAKLFNHEGPAVEKAVVAYHLAHTGVSRFDKFVYIYKNILQRKLTKTVFNRLCRQFARLVMKEVIKAPYVKGVKEFLTKYKKEYKFFVISATPHDEIKNIVQKREISRYFKEISGAPSKKSDLVRRVIRNNKLTSRELVYVGDAVSDYEAAKANSVEFIARINNNRHLFKGKDIDYRIKDFKKLKAVLRKIDNAQK